ncbi:CTP synthetase [Roseovarius aestuarii]|nr:CTP synthetase [Roseovarius aestuarii]
MGWLIIILHIFIGSTIAGALIIAALVIGHDSGWSLAGVAVLGYVAAIPVSWILARQLSQ